MDGLPTFYCILGVGRGAPQDQIEQACERKMNFTSYPPEVLIEAFDVLSDPRLQKEYDDLLLTFEQVTRCMPSHEKNELAQKHREYISVEKEYIRMGQILTRYRDYTILYRFGMPDLYEIAGLARDYTPEEMSRTCSSDSELLAKIRTVLNDPASREEYDFMLGFFARHGNKEHLEGRESNRKNWTCLARGVFEKIILTALNEPDTLLNALHRRDEILNNNQDWQHYLPPHKETFLLLLGLDTGSLRMDKAEVEKALRERYRPLEKTPEVNLAYSVLKNKSQREDYLWLLENREMLETLASLLTAEKVSGAKGKEVGSIIRERMTALIQLFGGMGKVGRRGVNKKPSTQEMLKILNSILDEGVVK